MSTAHRLATREDMFARGDERVAPHEIHRPDLVGWRRDRVPSRPEGRCITIRPDWIIDPAEHVLTVFRSTGATFEVARGETVRPEPFEAVPFPVGILFGDDA